MLMQSIWRRAAESTPEVGALPLASLQTPWEALRQRGPGGNHGFSNTSQSRKPTLWSSRSQKKGAEERKLGQRTAAGHACPSNGHARETVKVLPADVSQEGHPPPFPSQKWKIRNRGFWTQAKR